MYCKNCGHEMDGAAVVCTNCGFAKGTGNKYCQNCGVQVVEGQAMCTNCGVSLNVGSTQQPAANANSAAKSKLAAGLLGIFLGSLGIHNFYLGFTKRALIQLLVSVCTCGFGATAMWIWGLVEGIFYLTGKEGYTADANGVPLKD